MLTFIKEYLLNPSKIGAVAPSSRFLAQSIVQFIDFDKCNCIVEYGPGTGVFTKEILKNKKPDTLFMIIEQNEKFYTKLSKQYGHLDGVAFIHGSAADVCLYMEQHNVTTVDFIVSGLPFTSLPKEVSERILENTVKAIGKKGKFITFQYTLLKKHMFELYFKIAKVVLEFKNIPPAYVLVMRNKT